MVHSLKISIYSFPGRRYLQLYSVRFFLAAVLRNPPRKASAELKTNLLGKYRTTGPVQCIRQSQTASGIPGRLTIFLMTSQDIQMEVTAVCMEKSV